MNTSMIKRKRSLSRKAFIAIFVILLPILTTFFLSYHNNKMYLKQRIIDTLTVIAGAYEGQVYQFLEMSKRRAHDFTSDGLIKSQLSKIIHGNKTATNVLNGHLMKNKLILDKTINTINILSLEGRVVASTNTAEIGRDLSHEAYFVKGQNTMNVGEVYRGHKGLPEIVIIAPILSRRTGKPMGYVANYIFIVELNKLLLGEYVRDLGAISWGKGKGAWETLEIYLVNRNKLMITQSIFIKDAVLKQKVDTLPVELGLTASKEMTGFYKDYRGIDVVGASMYVAPMRWVLLVEIDKDEVLAPVKHILISALVTAAIVIVMVVLLFIGLLKGMVIPLQKISRATKAIAGGDFDVVIPVKSHDEIGTLCESFNDMAHQIKTRTAALEKSESRLIEAQRIAHIGNWEWDIVKNELYWSDEIYHIFGLTPREFDATYEAFLHRVHPQDRRFVVRSVRDALLEKKFYDIEHRILLKDGTVRVVHEKAVVTFDDTGKGIRMVGTAQDITERKRAEEEAHLLQTIIMSITEAKDFQSALGIVLRKVCETTGWTYGEAWIPSPHGNYLEFGMAWYGIRNCAKEFRKKSKTFVFPPGIGLPGRVWVSKKPEWRKDATVNGDFPRALIAKETGFKSAMGIPVIANDKVIAVLGFFVREKRNEDERLIKLVSVVANQLGTVIQRKRAEAALRESEERLQSILDNATAVIYVKDLQGKYSFINKQFEKLFHISRDNVKGKTDYDLWPKEMAEAFRANDSKVVRKKAPLQFDEVVPHDDGFHTYISIKFPLFDITGSMYAICGISTDITERKHFETQIIHMANRDPLTDLFNRRRFREELERWLAHAQRYKIQGALLFLDIDNFKYINDSLGHHEGDKFIIALANVLKERLRETDILARLGGDEFAIILPQTDRSQAIGIANQIRELIQRQTSGAEKHHVTITASIGIALFPNDGDTAETLLTCADLAMYRAKEEGRNRVCIYTTDQKTQVELRLIWESRIHEALRQNRFALYLQPIIDLHQNCIVGHEVLLRMLDEKGKLILPSQFLGIAERFGLIHEIDRWVVCRSIRLVEKLEQNGKPTCLEVNLSGRSFMDTELLPLIKKELTAANVDPVNLIFEITETSCIENIATAQKFIISLKNLGCRFALDDFGIGFSSFNYLKHLPVDYLKIDGSFIHNLSHDPLDQHIVRAMVGVARGLGKKTVAEFVEDEETVNLLREFGVNYAQGYHIGKPHIMSEL